LARVGAGCCSKSGTDAHALQTREQCDAKKVKSEGSIAIVKAKCSI